MEEVEEEEEEEEEMGEPTLVDAVGLLTSEEARRMLFIYAQGDDSLAQFIHGMVRGRVPRRRSSEADVRRPESRKGQGHRRVLSVERAQAQRGMLAARC